MHGETGHTQLLPKIILNYGTGGNLDIAANALASTANYLKGHGWRAGPRIPARRSQFCSHPGMECCPGLSAGHRGYWPTDRWRREALNTAPQGKRLSTSPLPAIRAISA